jgi:hypothetical protein
MPASITIIRQIVKSVQLINMPHANGSLSRLQPGYKDLSKRIGRRRMNRLWQTIGTDAHNAFMFLFPA